MQTMQIYMDKINMDVTYRNEGLISVGEFPNSKWHTLLFLCSWSVCRLINSICDEVMSCEQSSIDFSIGTKPATKACSDASRCDLTRDLILSALCTATGNRHTVETTIRATPQDTKMNRFQSLVWSSSLLKAVNKRHKCWAQFCGITAFLSRQSGIIYVNISKPQSKLKITRKKGFQELKWHGFVFTGKPTLLSQDTGIE